MLKKERRAPRVPQADGAALLSQERCAFVRQNGNMALGAAPPPPPVKPSAPPPSCSWNSFLRVAIVLRARVVARASLRAWRAQCVRRAAYFCKPPRAARSRCCRRPPNASALPSSACVCGAWPDHTHDRDARFYAPRAGAPARGVSCADVLCPAAACAPAAIRELDAAMLDAGAARPVLDVARLERALRNCSEFDHVLGGAVGRPWERGAGPGNRSAGCTDSWAQDFDPAAQLDRAELGGPVLLIV